MALVFSVDNEYHCGETSSDQGGKWVFAELTEELLDLAASEKGFRNAMYAQNEDEKCSSSCSGCIVLCCCHLCW